MINHFNFFVGTDLKLPESATSALNLHNQIQANALLPQNSAAQAAAAPPIATQCFMLSNMFDPNA
jgi:RNA-binding protein 39